MALFGKARARRLVARAARARALGDEAEGLRLAEAAVALDPTAEPAHTLVAELLPSGSDLEGAVARLRALLEQGSQAPRVRLRLASLLRRTGHAEHALEVLAPALPPAASVPDQLERLRQRGAVLAELERWVDCVAALRELVEQDAAHTVLGDLATALERSGQYEEALLLRRQLARFREDDWSAYLHALPRVQASAVATALGAEPEAALALPASGVLVRLAPQALQQQLEPLPAPWRLALQAHVERSTARPDDARATLRDVGEHPAARYELALLDMTPDTIDRAAAAFDRLAAEGWRLPGLAYWQAVAHHVAGDDSRAAAGYEALLAGDPGHGHAWYLLADIRERLEGRAAKQAAEQRAFAATPVLLRQSLRSQLDAIARLGAHSRSGRLDADDPTLVIACATAGEDERARTLLSRWVSRDGLDEPTRLSLARAGLGVEAFDEVARLVAPLVEVEHPEALAIDGERLVSAGKPVLGRERLQRATALEPGLGRAWEILGVVLAKAKDLTAAELPLRRAAALRPAIPDTHRNLARILLDTHRGAEAVEPAERAVAMLEPDADTLRLLCRAYAAAGDEPWAQLTAWAADYHLEQQQHRIALGGQWPAGMPGNVPLPPDVFRPTFGRFRRQLEALAAGQWAR